MKASAIILALLFSGVQSMSQTSSGEGPTERTDGYRNSGKKTTQCVCVDHPRNYLGNFKTD